MLANLRPPSRPNESKYTKLEADIDGDLAEAQAVSSPFDNERSQVEDDSNDKDFLLDEEPTELDLKTLRRVPGAIPWQAYTIAFVELCERFSYAGTVAVCK